MMEELSIPDLLNQLDVDQQNDAIKLCIEAENLRRRHYYEQAVKAAEHAESIAHKVFDSELQAVTLLYLSSMYAARRLRDDASNSLRCCERAVLALNLNQRNRVIAQLILAQLEWRFERRDEAIVHFYRTAQDLQKSIIFAREHRQASHVNLYESLLKDANAAVVELLGSFIEVPARSIAPKKRRRPNEIQAAPVITPSSEHHLQPEPIPFPFELPIQLDWPAPLELSAKNMSITNQAALLPNHDADIIEYIELTEISINGQPFVIEPLYAIPGSHSGALRMYRDKEYVPVHIHTEERKIGFANSYLLVQKQERPEPEAGIIVVENPSIDGARAFRYELEKDPLAPPRIIGAEREWDFHDGLEASPPGRPELHIIGVVVAWLKPRALPSQR